MIKFTLEYENLPFREKMKGGRRSWEYRIARWHSVQNILVWKRIERVLANNNGKSFAMAFHYYCTQVPKYQQHFFLNKFKQHRRYWLDTCDIDLSGNIIYKPYKYKRVYKIYSDDYRILWRHKKLNYITRERLWYKSADEYEEVIEGQVWEFESRRDPVLRAYNRKKQQRKKIEDRKRKALKKETSLAIFNYSMARLRHKILEERELDKLKAQQAGFDETSFTGEHYQVVS